MLLTEDSEILNKSNMAVKVLQNQLDATVQNTSYVFCFKYYTAM